MNRPNIVFAGHQISNFKNFICPHCGALQANNLHKVNFTAAQLGIIQCINCSDIKIFATLHSLFGNQTITDSAPTLFPPAQVRQSKPFKYAPDDVLKAYSDTCYLFPLHIGASGAYARRCLELILDSAGYNASTLVDSVKLARNEDNPDRRLPPTILRQLDYIKEIGNFALHARRDSELVIVDIDENEVSACLEIIEDMIDYLFEHPVAEFRRISTLNLKLEAAGKKPMPVPNLPLGCVIPELTNESEDY